MSGLVREALDLLPQRHAAEDEGRLHTRLGARDDVGVHPVADHHRLLGVRAEGAEGVAHHQWVRFADEIGLHARRGGDQGGDRPRPRF